MPARLAHRAPGSPSIEASEETYAGTQLEMPHHPNVVVVDISSAMMVSRRVPGFANRSTSVNRASCREASSRCSPRFCASGIWFFISAVGPSAWRWMYMIGVLPALATWWIRRGLIESDRWTESDRRRREVAAAQNRGEHLDEASRQLARFTLVDLFANPGTRRLTLSALLM